MYKLLMSISYDGSNYSGWIIQKNQATIQQKLNQAIKVISKTSEFRTIGASKTDAKVHALDQKVLLICDFLPNNLEKFISGLNKALPNDININNIWQVDDNFNIRQPKSKIYTYTINNGLFDVFKSRYELFWNYYQIDINQLQNVLNLFIGTHDFKLFSGLNKKEFNEINTIKTIDNIKVEKTSDNRILIHFFGHSFIRYQIRMIVGASLYSLMNKKITIDEIKQKLQGIGNKSTIVIDGCGLCLKKINF